MTPTKPIAIKLTRDKSAAEFGCFVWPRDHGGFVAVVKAGQTPALQCTHPSTKRIQYRLSAEDISSFHRRFVALTTLIKETGYHRKTLKSLLAATRVNPCSPEGQGFDPVFLRAEAIKSLK